jgi:nicotinate dehydrogenase subunit A
MTKTYAFVVNGIERTVSAAPETPLLSVLRDELDLVGTRFGCGLGQCGACVVQVDGTAVTSCDLSVSAVEGRSVRTVEGLADDGVLHRVQEAVLAAQAGQCGYCLSGILVSSAALLDTNPTPDEDEVVAVLDRHLCRCGVQRRILGAVMTAGRVAQ